MVWGILGMLAGFGLLWLGWCDYRAAKRAEDQFGRIMDRDDNG